MLMKIVTIVEITEVIAENTASTALPIPDVRVSVILIK